MGTPTSGGSSQIGSLDQFGRRTKLRWARAATGGTFTLLNTHYGYDRGSYMTASDDFLLDGYDEGIEVDGLGRIEVYKRGRQTAEGITDLTYRMDRHYDEVGNIELLTVDRNGDGLYTGSGERNESRAFNDANEMVSRTQPNGSITTTEYSANGELVKGADARERIYDAWGNLVRVEKDLGGQPILILRRDGLNRVIMQHAKPNGEGGLIHSSNPVLYYLPDGSGRPLAVFEAGELNPVLERSFHGPQSLVGCMEVRDDDSDGVRDRQTYVLPDATGSAAAFFDNSNGHVERIHYDPMGVPTTFPSGDMNADGKMDWDDYILMQDEIADGEYDEKGDTDGDGDLDVWDMANFDPKFAGEGVLSLSGNTLGLHQMPRTDELYLAHARTYSEVFGRWLSRDPSGFVDGPSVYQAMRGNHHSFEDRDGRQATGFSQYLRSGEWSNAPGSIHSNTDPGVPGVDHYDSDGASVTTVAPNTGRSFMSTILVGNHPAANAGGGVTGCSNCKPCWFNLAMRIDINGTGSDDNLADSEFENAWHGCRPEGCTPTGPTGESPMDWETSQSAGGPQAVPQNPGPSDSIRTHRIRGGLQCGEVKIIRFRATSTITGEQALGDGTAPATASMAIRLSCDDCVYSSKSQPRNPTLPRTPFVPIFPEVPELTNFEYLSHGPKIGFPEDTPELEGAQESSSGEDESLDGQKSSNEAPEEREFGDQ